MGLCVRNTEVYKEDLGVKASDYQGRHVLGVAST